MAGRSADKQGKRWPPPGFPLVHGDYALTETWTIHLPEQFARRVEDGSLVLWRPGLTLWLIAWGNDHHETQAQRVAWMKKDASPARFAEREWQGGGLTRFAYRLRDGGESGTVDSLYAMVIGDNGHLQVAVYFDEPADEALAWKLVESVGVRRTHE